MLYEVITSEQGEILERSDIPVGYVHGVGSDLLPRVEERLAGCEVGDTVSYNFV